MTFRIEEFGGQGIFVQLSLVSFSLLFYDHLVQQKPQISCKCIEVSFDQEMWNVYTSFTVCSMGTKKNCSHRKFKLVILIADPDS